ncbi:PAS domain-containing protein [Pseudomonadota bacterium]
MNTAYTANPSKKPSNELLAGLFETTCDLAFDSVMVTSAKALEGGYPIIFVNRAFTRMTGYTAEEIIGKSPGILQGPNTDPAVIERLASDLQAGRTFHGKAVNYRKDGSEFMLEWKVSPVKDAWGATVNLVSVQREVN